MFWDQFRIRKIIAVPVCKIACPQVVVGKGTIIRQDISSCNLSERVIFPHIGGVPKKHMNAVSTGVSHLDDYNVVTGEKQRSNRIVSFAIVQCTRWSQNDA